MASIQIDTYFLSLSLPAARPSYHGRYVRLRGRLRPYHPQPDGTQRKRTARGDGIGTASELRNLTVHEVRGQGAGHKEQGTGNREHKEGGKRRPAMVAAFCCARSEEHTSELQSLMRISYAVFCLKKTKRSRSYTNYSSTK